MALELESLKKAINSLSSILKKTNEDNFMSQLDDVTRSGLKAGVIKNFEFTYELCWKFMKRWLSHNINKDEIENLKTRRQLFRFASMYNLIGDPQKWFEYGDARNMTSHVYDELKAEKIYDVANKFINDANKFLSNLEKLND